MRRNLTAHSSLWKIQPLLSMQNNIDNPESNILVGLWRMTDSEFISDVESDCVKLEENMPDAVSCEKTPPADEAVAPPAKPAKPQRLASLDALRGFDMFWIIGGGTLFAAVAAYFESSFPFLQEKVIPQMTHVQWHGFVLHDLIFPLFIFLAGVSVSFSLSRRAEKQISKKKVLFQAAKRALLLIILGCVYNGMLNFPGWGNIRYGSVLGHIGIAYFFAAVIYLFADLRHRVIWTVGILLGYYAALRFITVPGGAMGNITMNGNVASYIDRFFLPGRLLYKGVHDPEGVFNAIPAVASCLLGALTGDFLRNEKIHQLKKAGGMLIAGIAALLLARLWHSGFHFHEGFFNPFIIPTDESVIGNALSFPINKNLWTSSFVLHTAGWGLILFSVFYFFIDICKLRWTAYFFIVIGANPIAIYMAQRLVNFNAIKNNLFGGFIKWCPAEYQAIVGSVCFILTWWLILLFCYRKKIFLKV